MASVSAASNGLGNTSLRGFGGFASGIDRDSMIEQMTMGTTTKISNQKKEPGVEGRGISEDQRYDSGYAG